MIQLKKYIFVKEELFKTFIKTLIRLSSLITILIFYLSRVIVYGILMFCKDGGNLQQSLQKVIIINFKYLKFYFDIFFQEKTVRTFFCFYFFIMAACGLFIHDLIIDKTLLRCFSFVIYLLLIKYLL
jgi:hypothetical protein